MLFRSPELSLPTATEVSEFVTLEYPETGGHVGFAGRDNWLATRILDYFTSE